MSITRRTFIAGAAAATAVGAAGAGVAIAEPLEASPDFACSLADAEGLETIECDILICGSGGTGYAAAATIANTDEAAGLKTLVIDKAAYPATMCNTASANGHAAIGSKYLIEDGETYTTDELYKRMLSYAHWTVNPRLVHRCIPAMIENVELFGDKYGFQYVILSDRYGMGFKPGVYVINARDEGEGTKFERLQRALEEEGIEWRVSCGGTKVVLDDAGVCQGLVAADEEQGDIFIKAKATLLCTGGFLGNDDMMTKVFGDATVYNHGSALNVGDDINMALAAGGFMGKTFALSINDGIAFSNKVGDRASRDAVRGLLTVAMWGGLLVDRHGDRFFDEYMLANEPLAGGGEATTHVGGDYYAVIAQKDVETVKEQGYYTAIGRPAIWTAGAEQFDSAIPDLEDQLGMAIEAGWAWKGDTVADLIAAHGGMENLEATVAAYNGYCADGYDPEFLKDASMLVPIGEEGPFYLIEYTPSAFITMGGIVTDHNFHVIRRDQSVVEGLFLAGSSCAGAFAAPYYDVGGTSSGMAMATGREAAKEMVAFCLA